MELQGKVIAVLEPRSGVSAKGPWMSQEYVIETHEQYPHKMVFNIFGEDKIKQFNIQSGEEISVSFDINAREWNGRWYNDIRAWKVDRVQPNAQAAAQPPTGGSQAPFPAPEETVADSGSADDLPF